ncbi:uncharacterized protein C05D11.1 [Lingula anatina]|uniref:Uncharacterized protein C05D11.1 n=1 Tax=Lingula anatina TaxID=7574 RepID=A0A1S3IPZ9_LINAN|nr:uncharacterized protein C05D11.1 [Lingula anatina]|eukprot:XP_013400143.1 uncharacterized protein C05D11.1 [Lingula anatina]
MYAAYKMQQDFELVCSATANSGKIPVYKYKSRSTGLTVSIAQVDGPTVSGYFCLATEAHDDDGLPHTLEHLVFMGSEKYPYKGVLDLLANRCLASGTNAWTDTDHTCYTMQTAGDEGFLTLMPIYVEHVLFATLTDSAYLTEVHHVTEQGEDAGVVYCEMQACENTGEGRTRLALLRAMYPGHCGYKSETGGMLENLRISTSNKKVVSYHQEFYRPENLNLIITGQVNPQDVFKALEPIQQKILAKGKQAQFVRPWQSEVPPLENSVEQIICYPSDDETRGLVRMAWRGPNVKDLYTHVALTVILDYLRDSAISPLQRDFVELEEPYCSNVSYSMIENREMCHMLTFQNVPKEKLKEIKPRLLATIGKIVKREEEIDSKRMETVIHKNVLDSMERLESRPHDQIAGDLIGDFLFSDTGEELVERVNQIEIFRKLSKENKDYWYNLLNQYFMTRPSVTIIGEPSKELHEKMAATEKERIEEQKKKLGETGLAQKGENLKKACEENEIEAPGEVITSVDIPNVSSIKFHPITTCHSGHAEADTKFSGFPLSDLPVAFQLNSINSNFVSLRCCINTDAVPQDLKYYLPLYAAVMCESPLMRNNELVSHEIVIQELEADTLSVDTSLGLSGGMFTHGDFPQLLTLRLKVECEKYKKSITWIHELLYKIQFKEERLKIVAQKMVNEVSRLKRRGLLIAQNMMKDMSFDKASNMVVMGFMRQHTFLTEMLEKLEKSPTEVIEQMKRLQKLLTLPENITIHMSADVTRLAQLTQCDPHEVWKQELLPKELQKEVGKVDLAKKQPIKFSHSFLRTLEETSQSMGIICGVAAVESAYLILSVPCLTTYIHADTAPVMVFIQYLTQLEGPMWRQIRGMGLSYGYRMSIKQETGQLYFILSRAAQLSNAYKQAKIIVEEFLTGQTEFTEVDLETAKSSLIFEIIEEETSVSDTAFQSILSYYRGVEVDYNRQLLQDIAKVSIKDLQRVSKQYFSQLFDQTKSRCAVCCDSAKVEELQKEFKELDRDLAVLPSLEEGLLAELKM